MDMTRKEETTVVKRAVIAAGFDQNEIRVTHGRGTAWGWLTIHAMIHRAPSCSCGTPDIYGRRETCDECKNLWGGCYKRIIEVAMQATGRRGEYDGRIGVNMGFFDK